MESSPQLLWERCLELIRNNVTEQQYKTWFTPVQYASYTDGTLTVQVPSMFVYEYLEEHYVGLLRKVLSKVFGEGTKLQYSVVADKTNKITVDLESTTRTVRLNPVPGVADPAKTAADQQVPRPQSLDSQLNPNYNFENFIEGMSNKLPRSVGQAIAEHPKQSTFNPLFIYGASGVGKTHLVNAIGAKIKELYPNKRVLYVSAHLFKVQYTDSVRKNTTNDFINFYQTIDVLIIDDVQEFASLTQTQNTFFHIFNHLHQNGKQLILTSDRPPVALQGMEDRLLTRFKWGLLAELEKPNEDLRRAILNNKIHHDGLKFPKEVIDYISENVNESVRDLEGIVNSLMAYSVVYNRDVDLSLAEQIVKRAVRVENKPITIDLILEKTCEYFNVKQEDIFTSSRKQAVVQVRQIAMYLAQKHTDLSSARIGALIGKRNHATVLYACNVVANTLHVDKAFRNKVEEIEALLKKR
ncbi:MAG: chromosomal replication initiator protein DnaA [Clostridium sp.]|nr:chromosomal replication initiator protein DnaA [Clostridium sp.]